MNTNQKLQFIGAGSAFSVQNFQSNAVLTAGNGKRLLIDFGGYVPLSLAAAGLTVYDIDAIYGSHLHADHVGGGEYLALRTKFDPRFVDSNGAKRSLRLFMHSSIRAAFWEMLRNGCVLPGKKSELEDFFKVESCEDSFEWEGTRFTLVRTTHCLDGDQPMPCFGLTWNSGENVIWFSSDTVFETERVQHLMDGADVIFHDCETAPFSSGVHAHYKQLVTWPAEVKAKVHAYHYNDGDKPDCVKDGFAGWVNVGEVFEL